MRKKILSKDTLKYLLKIILIAFSISWLIKPVLRLLPFKNIFFLEFTFIYLGYLLIYKYINEIKSKKTLLILMFATGLITRYILMPESFQLVNISAYLRRIFQFSLLIYIIRAVMNIEEKKSARIPFAPFLFLGALLANTKFLKLAMEFLAFIRR